MSITVEGGRFWLRHADEAREGPKIGIQVLKALLAVTISPVGFVLPEIEASMVFH